MESREVILKVGRFDAKVPEGDSTFTVEWGGYTFLGVRPGDWLVIFPNGTHSIISSAYGDIYFRGDYWSRSGISNDWESGEVCFDCPCGAKEIIISGPGEEEECECGRVYRVKLFVEVKERGNSHVGQ